MTQYLYKYLLELFRNKPYFEGVAKPLMAMLSFGHNSDEFFRNF